MLNAFRVQTLFAGVQRWRKLLLSLTVFLILFVIYERNWGGQLQWDRFYSIAFQRSLRHVQQQQTSDIIISSNSFAPTKSSSNNNVSFEHVMPSHVRVTRNVPNVFIIENAHACSSSPSSSSSRHGTNLSASFMVFIMTTADAHERRQLIRQTYANSKWFNRARARFVFLLGIPTSATSPALKTDADSSNNSATANFSSSSIDNMAQLHALQLESALHSDLIVADFADTYANLTLKTMVALKWYLERCQHPVWFVKIDDDVVLDVVKLKRFRDYYDDLFSSSTSIPRIQTPSGAVPIRILCSLVDRMGIANRFPLSKHYISWTEWPEWYFPQYCFGPGYAIPSYETAAALYNASFSVPLIHLEDVYFTGIVVRHLLQHHVRRQQNDFLLLQRQHTFSPAMPPAPPSESRKLNALLARTHLSINRGGCLEGGACWKRFRPIMFHTDQNQRQMVEVWRSMSNHTFYHT